MLALKQILHAFKPFHHHVLSERLENLEYCFYRCSRCVALPTLMAFFLNSCKLRVSDKKFPINLIYLYLKKN